MSANKALTDLKWLTSLFLAFRPEVTKSDDTPDAHSSNSSGSESMAEAEVDDGAAAPIPMDQ